MTRNFVSLPFFAVCMFMFTSISSSYAASPRAAWKMTVSCSSNDLNGLHELGTFEKELYRYDAGSGANHYLVFTPDEFGVPAKLGTGSDGQPLTIYGHAIEIDATQELRIGYFVAHGKVPEEGSTRDLKVLLAGAGGFAVQENRPVTLIGGGFIGGEGEMLNCELSFDRL